MPALWPAIGVIGLYLAAGPVRPVHGSFPGSCSRCCWPRPSPPPAWRWRMASANSAGRAGRTARAGWSATAGLSHRPISEGDDRLHGGRGRSVGAGIVGAPSAPAPCRTICASPGPIPDFDARDPRRLHLMLAGAAGGQPDRGARRLADAADRRLRQRRRRRRSAWMPGSIPRPIPAWRRSICQPASSRVSPCPSARCSICASMARAHAPGRGDRRHASAALHRRGRRICRRPPSSPMTAACGCGPAATASALGHLHVIPDRVAGDRLHRAAFGDRARCGQIRLQGQRRLRRHLGAGGDPPAWQARRASGGGSAAGARQDRGADQLFRSHRPSLCRA